MDFNHSLLWVLASTFRIIANGILLYMVLIKKTSEGISIRSQYLNIIVLLTSFNYNSSISLDLIYCFVMIFNASTAIIAIIFTNFVYPSAIDRKRDTLMIEIIIAISIILTIFTEPINEWGNLFSTFSKWTNSMSFLPQVILLGRSHKTNLYILKYMFFISIFNLFCILDGFYDILLHKKSIEFSLCATNIFQFIIQCDFLFVFIKSRIKQKEFELPY